jgi:hypothetical protein
MFKGVNTDVTEPDETKCEDNTSTIINSDVINLDDNESSGMVKSL